MVKITKYEWRRENRRGKWKTALSERVEKRKKQPWLSVLSLTENTQSYDCPFGQVMSYDWLCQVMSDCVALSKSESNHIITLVQQIHNDEHSEPHNSKLKRENNSDTNRFVLLSVFIRIYNAYKGW